MGRGSFIDVLEALFGPFYGLDIPSFYARYHPIIDFFLYAAVFISVARLTLDRVFTGRAGKALCVAIGLILALSLSIAERTLGFSIATFGPLAAGMIVALVGYVVYHLCRRMGAGNPVAASLATIIVYFSIRSVVPNLFEWMQQNRWAAFLHALLVLAILVALWHVLGALFRSPAERIGVLARGIESHGPQRIWRDEQESGIGDVRILRHRLTRFTRRGIKDSTQVIQDLQEMIEIVRTYGANRRALRAVANRLRDIRPRQHRLTAELDRIRKLDAHLRRFDLSQLRELQSEYRHLTPEQKRACMELFHEGRVKLDVEATIGDLAGDASEYQREFQYDLEMGAKHLGAGHADESIAWLEKAIDRERHAEELLAKILALEKRLISLVKRQIRQARAAE